MQAKYVVVFIKQSELKLHHEPEAEDIEGDSKICRL